MLTLSENLDWQQAFESYKNTEEARDTFILALETQFQELQQQQNLLRAQQEKLLKEKLKAQYAFSKKR
ncbi:MAG: hypothetical protein HWD61_02375 [Parachlamydiaceae bacterium]|nr:MAG: hypothetical protein HWD61_02375 [Parachlamydiaceae bacterium]